MILDYLGPPSVFRRVSMSVRVKRRKHRGSRGWSDAGPLAKQCEQPPEAEKGKECISPGSFQREGGPADTLI